MDTFPLEQLQVAGGSIPGREHSRSARDNQDAFAFVRSPGALFGVVCDGCGSMPFSGLGAHLGARLLLRSLSTQLEVDPERPTQELLTEAQAFVLQRLRDLARDLSPSGEPWRATALRRFLFTVVGFLVRPDQTDLFACGDGVVSLNGDAAALGPFPGNRPPYLAYRLLEDTPEAPDLQVISTRATTEVHQLMVGTDGVLDWIDLGNTPGVPSIRDTLAHPAATANPDFLRRRLTVAQRQGGPGALPDDTTLVLVRRVAA